MRANEKIQMEPAPDVMRELYEEYDRHQFRNYSPPQGMESNPRIVQICRIVGSEARVLDVGVNRGDFAVELTRTGNKVVGLDISSRAVEICQQQGIDAYRLNVETEAIPASLGTFDVIVFLEIIEHLIDPIKTLRKLRAVLNDKGCLVLSTPNAAYIKWRLDLMRGRLPDFGEDRQVPSEVRPYNLLHKTPLTMPVLKQTLLLSGFTPVHIEPEDY